MRASSSGSRFSPRSTAPSSTARATPTEVSIYCPVCQSLSRNPTAVALAVSLPWMMTVSSSSGPSSFALLSSLALVGLGGLVPRPVERGFGVALAHFVVPTPPTRRRGCCLDIRATRVWHRTVGFSYHFLFCPADPPPLGDGSDPSILATSTVVQDCVTYVFSVSVVQFRLVPLDKVGALLRFFSFPSTHSRPAPVAFTLSLTDRPPSYPFLLVVSCRLRSLAVQRCGSEFEEPHLRLMF